MDDPKKTILLTGGSGFIGKELGIKLVQLGYKINLVCRDPEKVRNRLPYPCSLFAWEDGFRVPTGAAKGCHAVIHLAGEPIMESSWSEQQKQELTRSRTDSAKGLLDSLKASGAKPEVIVSASAIGYYGDRGDEELDESALPGEGFASELCEKWEQVFQEHSPSRTVQLRIGIVLGQSGGALEKIVPLYYKGLGGQLGNGKQYISWIHKSDMVGLIIHALHSPDLKGPVNATAPTPVPYKEFHNALNAAIGSHGNLPAPALALKTILGERSRVLLASQRVIPKKALESAYKFQFESVVEALMDILHSSVQLGAQQMVVKQWIPASIDKVWDFFSDAKNLERITPAWLNFSIVELPESTIREGSLISYQLKLHGVPIRWKTKIANWTPKSKFIDTQIKGPYTLWHHTHMFEPLADGVLMTDHVEFKVPMGWLGSLLAGGLVESDVKKIFSYRSQAIANIDF